MNILLNCYTWHKKSRFFIHQKCGSTIKSTTKLFFTSIIRVFQHISPTSLYIKLNIWRHSGSEPLARLFAHLPDIWGNKFSQEFERKWQNVAFNIKSDWKLLQPSTEYKRVRTLWSPTTLESSNWVSVVIKLTSDLWRGDKTSAVTVMPDCVDSEKYIHHWNI